MILFLTMSIDNSLPTESATPTAEYKQMPAVRITLERFLNQQRMGRRPRASMAGRSDHSNGGSVSPGRRWRDRQNNDHGSTRRSGRRQRRRLAWLEDQEDSGAPSRATLDAEAEANEAYSPKSPLTCGAVTFPFTVCDPAELAAALRQRIEQLGIAPDAYLEWMLRGECKRASRQRRWQLYAAGVPQPGLKEPNPIMAKLLIIYCLIALPVVSIRKSWR